VVVVVVVGEAGTLSNDIGIGVVSELSGEVIEVAGVVAVTLEEACVLASDTKDLTGAAVVEMRPANVAVVASGDVVMTEALFSDAGAVADDGVGVTLEGVVALRSSNIGVALSGVIIVATVVEVVVLSVTATVEGVLSSNAAVAVPGVVTELLVVDGTLKAAVPDLFNDLVVILEEVPCGNVVAGEATGAESGDVAEEERSADVLVDVLSGEVGVEVETGKERSGDDAVLVAAIEGVMVVVVAAVEILIALVVAEEDVSGSFVGCCIRCV
jgi:hypothetical protein